MLNTDVAKTIDAVEVFDDNPVLSNVDMPLRAMYFPLGFPLEITSNSPAVMAAAKQSWNYFQKNFACSPLKLRIGVHGDDGHPGVPSAPVYRMQWNLLSNIADAHNFVVSDLREGHSFGWITQSTADSSLYLRYHLLEAAALSLIASLRATPLHAACVDLWAEECCFVATRAQANLLLPSHARAPAGHLLPTMPHIFL